MCACKGVCIILFLLLCMCVCLLFYLVFLLIVYASVCLLLHNNTRTKYDVCKKLRKGFRYIGDIVFFNSETQFEAEKSKIYPQELTLNKENNLNQKASFLDIDTEITDKKFVTSLYDKRKDFNFEMVNHPFLCGNFPKRPSYGVFLSQIVRFSRVCMKYQCFIGDCRMLVRKLLRQGYKENIMKVYLDRLSNLYQRIYNKDSITIVTPRGKFP